MENKNVNFGSITSGGNVIVGDVIQGIPHLSKEFKEQIEVFKRLLYSFKPKTALELLNDLENRIENSNLVGKELLLSEIYFLQSLCKEDLLEYSRIEVSKGFIKAFKLNEKDSEIRNRACLGYLNLNENEKALTLAKEILELDEFNSYAWFVIIFSSDSILDTYESIPITLKNDYYFRQSVVYQLLRLMKVGSIEDLEKYNLPFEVDLKRYAHLTYQNKTGWQTAIDLLINKFFNDYPIRFIAGKKDLFLDNEVVNECLILLEKYLNKLEGTELEGGLYHQKFFYFYLKNFTADDEKYYHGIKEVYQKIKVPDWFYTFTYCQVINSNGSPADSLPVLAEFEKTGVEKISEFYLFKAAILGFLDKNDELITLFDSYLDCVTSINERIGFNLLNTFLNILFRKVSKNEFTNLVEKVLLKKFDSGELKKIFRITLNVRYDEKKDETKSFEQLKELTAENRFDLNYKNLLAENLANIGETEYAINYLRNYVDKTKISETLYLYIRFLEKFLFENTKSGKGISKELIELLQFWRVNSPNQDVNFLSLEHNLNSEKNDWEELYEIDKTLYESFPRKEYHLLLYLNTLVKLNLDDEVNILLENIPDNFSDENAGVRISLLLLQREINCQQKGARILYNLASDSNNTEARKHYLIYSNLFPKDFCKEYDIVEKNCWVTFSVNDEVQTPLKIVNEQGNQGKFLGRKVNETFMEEGKFTNKLNTVKILRVNNDELILHLDIQKEIQNPLNDLGFVSMNIPKKIEDFEDFLKDQFGIQGAQEKSRTNELLNDYYNHRIGFTEISKSVFKESFIDAYLILTRDPKHSFTTIPSLATKSISKDKSPDYTIDFTSLMLFLDLEEQLGFKFKRKFKLSYLVKEHIEAKVIEEKNSPESKLSIQITPERVERFIAPENYKDNRLKHLNSILDWIDRNCEIDLVEEKLDITFNENLHKEGKNFDPFMKILVDSMFLSIREQSRLITSDISLFLIQAKGGTAVNLLNPEKYINFHFPNKCNTDFYRFLLKSNYIGISINLDTLKREFYDFLVGKENYYIQCLNNLQYSIHNNPAIIDTLILFLREIYLMSTMSMENKNRYALELFKFSFYGMPQPINKKLESELRSRFKLLGKAYDEVLMTFNDAKKLYGFS